MALADTSVHRDWILRVLRVDVASRPSAQSKPLSIVALGKARLAWGATRSKAVQDLTRLRRALEKAFANEPEQQAQLNAALVRMSGLIDQFDTTLEDQLDALLNAADAGRAPLAATARRTLDDMIAFINTDPLMQAIDDNDLLPKLKVTAPMSRALGSIADVLPSGTK